MRESIPLEALFVNAQAELVKLKLSSKTVQAFAREWRKLFDYAGRRGAIVYTSELAHEYSLARCGKDLFTTDQLSSNEKNIRRYIMALDDYATIGVIRHWNNRKVSFPAYFESDAMAYLSAAEKLLSHETVRLYRVHLGKFTNFLYGKGLHSFSEITATLISEYITTFLGLDQCTIHVRLCSLRAFLRYFFETGIHEQDMSAFIPKFRVAKDRHIQTTWEPEEAKKMLACVDRGSAVGLRDYAIMLLAITLGMRVGDIRDLKFQNIDWEAKVIRYTQNKNQQGQELPLFDEVGWALIDYIRHGRPQTDSDYIFIRHIPPYNHFSEHGSFWSLVAKYARMAGLTPKKRGALHSLRHSLDSSLLKQEIPLPVISSALGHSDINSTNAYLKIDLPLLRKCTLNYMAGGERNV